MIVLKNKVDIPPLQYSVYCVCFLLNCGPAYLYFVQEFVGQPYGLFHSGTVLVGPSLQSIGSNAIVSGVSLYKRQLTIEYFNSSN